MSSPKRRRIHSPVLPDALLSEIKAEVDLDIALKRQLTGTLESRITWALMLQEMVQKENGHASEETLRSVALDALSVVEHPSDYILCRDPVPLPSVHTTRPSRPHSKKVQSPYVKQRPSYLYIRSNALVNPEGNPENHLYLLKCPGCSRTGFTSLQGLLNHARLTHNLEWGTHDECIRACAVVDNDLDVDAGIEVGVGPGGILPGLRTIFQNAVGHVPAQTSALDATKSDKQSPPVINHLRETLGLHEDSPALAPFLGKNTVRRQIKVWNEDFEVDLETKSSQSSIRSWKMPFTPRNFDDDAINQSSATHVDTEKIAVQQEGCSSKFQSKPLEGREAILSNRSRFYFTTRIVIMDRSLWIPVEQRSGEHRSYSHKWMISVDSPSYTHHITSVLRTLRVVPCDPTDLIPIPPATSDPPFVVVGYSDKPFLARVELSFPGTGSELPEQKVALEHWVDLDPFRTREPVTGQEQVVDIELDRDTMLGQRKSGYIPIGAKSLWGRDFGKKGNLEFGLEDPSDDEDQNDYELPAATRSILNDTVKQFPMTLSDSNAKEKATSFPYRLVSPGHFLTLVTGRQKAIEWSRARAIQEAYTRRISELKDSSLADLSVADVYSWLSENRHFIRDNKVLAKHGSPITTGGRTVLMQAEGDSHYWCPMCGLDNNIHAGTVASTTECEEGKGIKESLSNSSVLREHSCRIVPKSLQIVKLPRVDVSHTISEELLHENENESASLSIHGSSLAVDPVFALSIQKLVSGLGFSTFHSPGGTAQTSGIVSYPIDLYGQNRQNVQRSLKSVHLLALLTQQFIRTLIQRGLDVADRDKVIASSRSIRREVSNNKLNPNRIMTPTHILSGILTRGRGRGGVRHDIDTVLLSSLSKLGAAAENIISSRDLQGDASPEVKLEE